MSIVKLSVSGKKKNHFFDQRCFSFFLFIITFLRTCSGEVTEQIIHYGCLNWIPKNVNFQKLKNNNWKVQIWLYFSIQYLQNRTLSIQKQCPGTHLPTTTTCPNTWLLPMDVQFQRWCLNCLWHSDTPSRVPSPMATTMSGRVWHSKRWGVVRPGILLQMSAARTAITQDIALGRIRRLVWVWRGWLINRSVKFLFWYLQIEAIIAKRLKQ